MKFSVSSTLHSSKTLTNNNLSHAEVTTLLERADKVRFAKDKGVNTPEQKIDTNDLWWVLPLLLAGKGVIKLYHETRYVGSLMGNRRTRQNVLFSGFPEVRDMLA